MQLLDSNKSAAIGSILYFDDVSINLFSTKTIVIISNYNSIYAELQNNTVFSLFSVNAGTIVDITKSKQLKSTTKLSNSNKYVHTLHVYAKTDQTDTFIDDLVITENNVSQSILLQVTTINEEERFAVALSNNKFYINDTFIKAFKDSDLNEHYTDYKLLNAKRKELLLDLFSIKSFIGVYAGLINALKYFGYDDDVFIKEFWSYFDKSINNYRLETKNIETDVSTVTKGYTKTNMFNITYKLNDITGDYDDDNLPALMDVFYNELEAIIKMQNLRLILESYFMPAHAIIVEIVGEHTSFYKSGYGYYIHNAIIHYYSTEIDTVFDIIENPYHEFTQVQLTKLESQPVLYNKYCVQLDKIYDDNLDVNDITDIDKFYKDNFAICTINFNQKYYDFIENATINVILKSTGAVLLTIADIADDADVINIGFLSEHNYVIHVSCTDKYNILHSFKHDFTTKFIKHDFDIFTVKHALNYTEPVKKSVFKSTKDAFEYFKYYDAHVAHNKLIAAIKYAGLPIIQGYESLKKPEIADFSGIQNAFTYNNKEQFALLSSLQTLTPYRYITSNLVNVNEFNLNVDKYDDIKPELAALFNKGYLCVYHQVNVGANTLTFKLNKTTYKFSFSYNNKANYSTNVSAILTEFYKAANSTLTNIFDCYVYYVTHADDRKTYLYVNLISKAIYDTVKTVCVATQYEFKNVIDNTGAFAYINLSTTAAALGKSAETTDIPMQQIRHALILTANGVQYTMNTADLTTALEVKAAIQTLINTYAALSAFNVIVLDDNSLFINGNMTFTIKHSVFGTVGGTVRSHVINDLIKLQPGDDIMKYSIIFAKINEQVKCRPFDITWSLYENSNNSKNLVYTSTDYFFHYTITDASSYTLELSYYDRAIPKASSVNLHGDTVELTIDDTDYALGIVDEMPGTKRSATIAIDNSTPNKDVTIDIDNSTKPINLLKRITKNGAFLSSNNKYSSMFKPFALSTYEYE